MHKTHNSLQPCHLRTRGIFRIRSNTYNGAICSQHCVIPVYLEHYHIHNLRNIQNPVKHLWCSIFFRTFCNPSIFRILVCSEPEEYSKPCQVSMMQRFLNEPWHIYDEVFYSEPFVTYLNSRYIQILSIFRTQDIHYTVNL